MEPTLRILLLEDSADDAALIERMLKKEGIIFNSLTVESRQEFEKELINFRPDVVISDHSLPQFNSQMALEMFNKYKENVKPIAVFVLVTGTVSEEFAVQIIKEGADDYILKDRLTRLPSAIMGALKKNRLAEEKKKTEEEKIQLLEILQKSLNEIFIFSSDGLKFKYANEEALKNLGFSMEEMAELTPIDLIEGASEEEFRQLLDNITLSRRGKIFESYGIRKDQSRFPAQIHLQLIEEHGKKKTFLANVLDISDIKTQEQQKELAFYIQKGFNENSGLRSSLELVLEGICRRQNITAVDFFAHNFDQTRLKRFACFTSGPELQKDLGLYLSELSLNNNECLYFKNIQDENLPADLKKPFFRTVKSFPIGLGNEHVGVLNFYQEEEMREKDFIHLGEGLRNQFANNFVRKKTEDEMTKIFNYSPEIIAVVSRDGFFKKLNPSLSKLTGFSTEEILDTPFEEFIHPEDHHIIVEWEKNILAKEVCYYENRFKTKCGEYRWISWSVTPFLEEGLSFAMGKDITGLKQNLESIAIQNKKLAEIAWEQSHVVRAPLARMMGCIHYLEERDDHSEELLENIKKSAQELDGIIKSIVNRAELIKNI